MPQKIKGGLEVGKDVKVGNILLDPSLATTDRTVQFPDVGGLAVVTSANLTQGSIPFVGSTVALEQDNANLFYDNTNNRLGIQNNAPETTLEVSSDSGWTIGTSPTPTAVASDTGGTVAAGTYYFKVVATFYGGFAAAGAESNAATVTTSTGSIAISWTPVSNATFYQVFRTTTSGTYTSPTLIATTSGSSFTWTDGVATSGTPTTSTTGQTIKSGKGWINDVFTTTAVGYTSVTVNSVSNISANDTNVTNGFAVRKAVPSSNTYNHGVQRGILSTTQFRGSGTSGAVQAGQFAATYGGTGSSSGAVTGAFGSATYVGTNTLTIGAMQGISGTGSISSNGRVTSLYGGTFTASVASSGSQNPTAGTAYGVRGDVVHTSTGKTVDNMYGVYGNVNATATGGTATRIQGGYFQASVGNGTGGGAVSASSHRGVQGWAYQNNTGTSSQMIGGLFTATGYGTVTNEITGTKMVGENQSTTATTPLIIGGKMYALNYKTVDTAMGGFAQVQHNTNTFMYSARGVTSAVINNSSGTIDDARGLNLNVLNNSGTINTGYGVFIGTVAGTTAFGLYQQSSGIKNYFGSSIAIGGGTSQNPTSDLHIDNGNATSAIRIGTFGDAAKDCTISNTNGKITIAALNNAGGQGIALNVNGGDALRIDTEGDTRVAGNIILSNTTKFGVNNTTTYGWRDNTAAFIAKGSGANNPSWGVFRNGIYGYTFSASTMQEVWANFHVDHDYAAGTVLYPHIHWSPTTTSTGTVRWGIEYTVAKGHQQGASSTFGTTTTIYVEQVISTNSQYQHFVSEVSLADAIPSTNVEPDTVIMVRFFRDANHANDTFPDTVVGIFGDLHYQVNTLSTINKSPNFYA